MHTMVNKSSAAPFLIATALHTQCSVVTEKGPVIQRLDLKSQQDVKKWMLNALI